MFTLVSALRWWATDRPDAIAISVDDEPVTFGELYAWAGRMGERLQAMGVKPGDRVSMVAMNSLPYAILAIAVMRIGAIGSPFNFRSTASEIRDWFGDVKPTVVFTDEARRPNVAEALEGSVPIHAMDEVLAVREGEAPTLDYNPDPDAAVFIIGTSGSTARPKGVIYSHRTIMAYAAEYALTEPRCAAGSSVLSPGPFSSSSGYLLLMQFTAMGVTMFIETQFIPERALRLLADHRITTFQGPPIFFERMAAEPGFADADLSGLYWTQVGGARVSPALLQAWRDKGVVLRQLYGSTESGGGWAARLDTAIDHPEKCGRGGMFTRYAILAEDGGFAPAGTPGEILVQSACMSPGYWANPEANGEAFKDGWLHTGDLGVLDERGNVTFIDRLKDIIISGGLNISAAEVENAIAAVPGVEEVAVISAPDPKFGETPLAVVFGDAKLLRSEAIIAHCDRMLANYKVPRYVAIQDEPLPRLPSGKISKPALRTRYQGAESYLPKVR